MDVPDTFHHGTAVQNVKEGHPVNVLAGTGAARKRREYLFKLDVCQKSEDTLNVNTMGVT
jgi:hypothetical protein